MDGLRGLVLLGQNDLRSQHLVFLTEVKLLFDARSTVRLQPKVRKRHLLLEHFQHPADAVVLPEPLDADEVVAANVVPVQNQIFHHH